MIAQVKKLVFIVNLADLIVTVKSKEHERFHREEDCHLVHWYDISLKDALNSIPLSIHTIEGRLITVTMDEIISPDLIKQVDGYGLPKYNPEIRTILEEQERGHLFVRFNIQFPIYIQPNRKEEIINLLNEIRDS